MQNNSGNMKRENNFFIKKKKRPPSTVHLGLLATVPALAHLGHLLQPSAMEDGPPHMAPDAHASSIRDSKAGIRMPSTPSLSADKP